jgi:hypothetical protein
MHHGVIFENLSAGPADGSACYQSLVLIQQLQKVCIQGCSKRSKVEGGGEFKVSEFSKGITLMHIT